MRVIQKIKDAAVRAYNPEKRDDANDALNRIIGLCEGAQLVHSVNPLSEENMEAARRSGEQIPKEGAGIGNQFGAYGHGC